MSIFKPLNQKIHDWQEQRVWVVGASSGIGEALAKVLLQKGAKVILTARRLEQLNQIAAPFPNNALVAAFDVCEDAQWDHAYQQINNRFGGVDLVIFCAAKYQPERSWEVKTPIMRQTLQINLQSVYQGLHTVLPTMMSNKNGGLAIIASVAGYVGLPNASVYGPSKAALINLAEILYTDLHPENINVYLINPGFVKTPLTEKNSFEMPALQTPEQAANAILDGMKRGKFEIHFPRRFTAVLKLLQMFPYRLRFVLMKFIDPQANH